MRKQILANLNWLLADRLMRAVGGLFVGIWIARYLGPGDFGLLNFALSFVVLFAAVGKLSIEPLIIRELTQYPDREKVILGSIFRLKLWASVAAMVLVFPAAWLAQPDNPMFLILVITFAAGIIFTVLDPIDIFYQAKVQSRPIIQARAGAFLAFIVVRIGLVLGGFSVVWFALAGTLEAALAAGLIFFVYHRKEGGFREWVWQKSTANFLLKNGWPLIASSLLAIIHARLDQVMIGQLLGEVQVGHYSAAVRISETWLLIPFMAVQTLLPYFVLLREQSSARYQQRLMQLYSVMFWLGAVAGVMTIFFGREAIGFLFGVNYLDAYGSLVFLIWTGIFIAQAAACGIWMISENLQMLRLFSNLTAVPINIILNLLWIPEYGITGAAAASLISVGIGAWVAPLFFSSLRKSNLDLIRSIHPRYLVVRDYKS